MSEITTRPHRWHKSFPAYVDVNGEQHAERHWEEPSSRIIAERDGISAFAGTKEAAIRMVERIEAHRNA
jgi:hypothetical protein